MTDRAIPKTFPKAQAVNPLTPRRAFRLPFAIVSLALLFVTTLPLLSSLVLELNLVQLEGRAETIVHGRCLALREVPDGQPLPYTEYTFEVLHAVKGCQGPTGKLLEKITFRHAGTEHGALRADGTEIAPLHLGIPTHKVGEETVLFLTKESKAGLCAPVGLAIGKLSVERKDGVASVINARGKKLFQDVPAASFAGLNAAETGALEAATLPSGNEKIELGSFLGLCGKVKSK